MKLHGKSLVLTTVFVIGICGGTAVWKQLTPSLTDVKVEFVNIINDAQLSGDSKSGTQGTEDSESSTQGTEDSESSTQDTEDSKSGTQTSDDAEEAADTQIPEALQGRTLICNTGLSDCVQWTTTIDLGTNSAGTSFAVVKSDDTTDEGITNELEWNMYTDVCVDMSENDILELEDVGTDYWYGYPTQMILDELEKAQAAGGEYTESVKLSDYCDEILPGVQFSRVVDGTQCNWGYDYWTDLSAEERALAEFVPWRVGENDTATVRLSCESEAVEFDEEGNPIPEIEVSLDGVEYADIISCNTDNGVYFTAVGRMEDGSEIGDHWDTGVLWYLEADTLAKEYKQNADEQWWDQYKGTQSSEESAGTIVTAEQIAACEDMVRDCIRTVGTLPDGMEIRTLETSPDGSEIYATVMKDGVGEWIVMDAATGEIGQTVPLGTKADYLSLKSDNEWEEVRWDMEDDWQILYDNCGYLNILKKDDQGSWSLWMRTQAEINHYNMDPDTGEAIVVDSVSDSNLTPGLKSPFLDCEKIVFDGEHLIAAGWCQSDYDGMIVYDDMTAEEAEIYGVSAGEDVWWGVAHYAGDGSDMSSLQRNGCVEVSVYGADGLEYRELVVLAGCGQAQTDENPAYNEWDEEAEDLTLVLE